MAIKPPNNVNADPDNLQSITKYRLFAKFNTFTVLRDYQRHKRKNESSSEKKLLKNE